MDFTELREKTAKLDSTFSKNVLSFSADKALVINLESKKVEDFQIPEIWLSEYVSGPALGARLWVEFAKEDADEVVLTTSRFGKSLYVGFKSPQNGKLTFNSAQTVFSRELVNIGYSAVIVRGKLDHPESICISENKVSFGSSFSNTTGISIGLAGEHLVPFSIAICRGKSMGRGGLGYVLGKMGVKSLNIKTEGEYPLSEEKPDARIVENATGLGWAPVRNFSGEQDLRLVHLTGREVRRSSAISGNKTLPDWDVLFALGSNTGCFDSDKIIKRYQKCLETGLDPISTGTVLSALKVGSDNEKALEIIQSIADYSFDGRNIIEEIEKSPDLFKINNLECAPVDFRSNHAEALNQMLGNWFYVYPGLLSDICIFDPALWVLRNERIMMGIQSYGLEYSSFSIPSPFAIRIASVLFKFSSKLSKLLCKRCLLNNEKISYSDIVDLGKRCSRLVSEINSFICNEKVDFPEHFTGKTSENIQSGKSVPLRSMFERYFCLSNDFIISKRQKVHKS